MDRNNSNLAIERTTNNTCKLLKEVKSEVSDIKKIILNKNHLAHLKSKKNAASDDEELSAMEYAEIINNRRVEISNRLSAIDETGAAKGPLNRTSSRMRDSDWTARRMQMFATKPNIVARMERPHEVVEG